MPLGVTRRRFPPPWTVEDYRASFRMMERPCDGGRLAVTGGENGEHDQGTCSHSDLSQMWCATYRRRGFADYRYAQMPSAWRYRHPQRTSGSDPSAETGKCFNGAMMTPPEGKPPWTAEDNDAGFIVKDRNW
jgi:hypothetical protein